MQKGEDTGTEDTHRERTEHPPVDRRQEKQLSGREDRERKAENGRETTDDGQKDRPGLKTKTIRHPPKQSGT